MDSLDIWSKRHSLPQGAVMFERSFVNGARTNRSWTTLVGFLAQSIFLGVMVLVPLIWPEAIPAVITKSILVVPPSPPPPPPPPPVGPVIKVVKVIPRQFDPNRFFAPRVVPKEPKIIIDEAEPPLVTGGPPVIVGGIPCGKDGLPPCGNSPVGIPWGSGPGFVNQPAPPPPLVKKAAEERPKAPPRIAVGGNVQQAKLVRQPKPMYPDIAQRARISGIVHLEAVISKEGVIVDLKVVSGHPLLIPAALAAVKQWVYLPTLLNGEPVEVQTQIDVNFTLSQ